MEWKFFDRVMMEAEHVAKKGQLSNRVVKALKANGCWKNGQPYCTYDHFTYKMSNDQVKEIASFAGNMKD